MKKHHYKIEEVVAFLNENGYFLNSSRFDFLFEINMRPGSGVEIKLTKHQVLISAEQLINCLPPDLKEKL